MDSEINITLVKLIAPGLGMPASDHTRKVFEIVNEAALCSAVGLFGMITNAINMVVFAKQGLGTTVNISLFSLSLSDFGGVATLVWFGTCKNPLFMSSSVPLETDEVGYLTGAWPHGVFARITCWLTAYITAERCLCIALPLKSKQIITPMRTTWVICCIYLSTIFLQTPQYACAYLDWQFHQRRNKTVVRLMFSENAIYMNGLSYVLNAVNGTLSFSAVMVFTIFLTVKLREQRAWRKTTVAVTDLSKSKNRDRDKKTMFMILMISVVLIICYIPGMAASVIAFVEPEFSVGGLYENAFAISWTICFLFETVNSSVGIFFYCKMSTRYRTTFMQLFVNRQKGGKF